MYLINKVVSFCDKEYQTHICQGCANEASCKNDCKNCLDDLHYHINNIRDDYGCEHLLDYYVCRYSYKYCSEIIYALNNIDLSKYPYFSILSLGCGGSPDLMAFDYMDVTQPIKYKGFDINNNWSKIHNFIMDACTELKIDTEYYRDCDVLDFLSDTTINGCNVIIIEYLISFFYDRVGYHGLVKWFDQLAQQIVAYKPADSPMLIIINDADSINIGRDYFPLIRDSIEQQGIEIINDYRRRFKNHNYYSGSKMYNSQANCFDIPDNFGDKYKVAIRCEAAQLILEVK